MVDWPLVLIVLVAVVVLGGLLGLAAWWYLPPVDLPGPDSMPAPRAGESSSDEDGEQCVNCLRYTYDPHSDSCSACGGSLRESLDWPEREDEGWDESEDDEWADQLHAINQLGKFGDLTRPVADLTHYEVEALIRTLAVPEWVPDRYRMAA